MAHAPLAGVLRHIRLLIGSRDDCPRSDGQLLQQFVEGRDESAFAELVGRHGPMVLGVCRRVLGDPHDADDAFQATFLILTRKARSLRQWGSLGNWLYTVAYHLALRARATAARRRAQERQVEDMPEPEATLEPWRELSPRLDGEVNRLPAKYRAPVVLCYIEGKTNEEAAAELGWPAGTVKCRLARARELLRRRLVGNGVALEVGLLTPALTEQATAAVSASLLETTLRTASLFAAGEIVAATSISGRAVPLAEGALRTMFVHKLQAVAAVLVTLGLVSGSAGVWMQAAPAEPAAENESAVVARAEAPDAPAETAVAREKDVPRPGERARSARRALAQYVTVPAIAPNTSLEDAVKILSEQFKIPIDIDMKAFEAIGVARAQEQPVELPKMTNVRLGAVLKRLTAQVRGDQYTGTYLVKPSGVEVTTTYHQWLEAGADWNPPNGGTNENLNPFAGPGPAPADDAPIVARELGYFGNLRRMTTVVHVDYERLPLVEALRDLADDTGFDILIDPRVADKAKAPVTLGLNAVWLDNALNLLTEMTDLDWYWMDKVAFITTKENAKARRDKIKAASAEQPRPVEKQPENRKSVSVNCSDQPLVDVLRGLAGVQTVVDGRALEKAGAKITARFDQVPPEAALRILADMADLAVVPLDRVFYITSKENARAMQGQPAKPEK